MINLKEFKQAVLQKAMQGKLTKQLSSDGNARSQIKYIFKSKIQLSKEYKIRNYNKHLNVIQASNIPYKLPHNWIWVTLNDVCELLNGRTYKRNELLTDSSLTPVLRVGNLFTNKKWYYSNLQLSEKHYVNHGDLIYAWSASFGPRIWNGPRAIFHMHIWKILMSTKYLNKHFMYYLLLDITRLIKFESHGTSMKHITKTKMNNIIIPLPPLTEQQRIVSKVHKCFLFADTIQKERDLHRKFANDMKQSLLLEAMKGHLTQQLPSDGNADNLLQLIQQKKQQLIQAGKIRKHKKLPPISKDEIPFKIPKNWKWTRLGNICSIENGDRGKYYPGKKYWVDKGIPFLNAGSLNKDGTINMKNVHHITSKRFNLLRSGFIHRGDILYTLRGSIGKVSLNEQLSRGAIASSLTIIHSYSMNPKFLILIFLSGLNNKFLNSIRNGTAQPNVSASKLINFMLPLPPLAEQHRIVSIIQKYFSLL